MILHAPSATAAAAAILAAREGEGADLLDADVTIAPTVVTVTLIGRTDTLLLRLLDSSFRTLDVTVTVRAAPHVRA